MKAAAALLIFVLPGMAIAQESSTLWGKSGENWTPQSRLPDYSYAGYRAGEAPIPTVAVVRNLKTDYGAAGDGVKDDTVAFQTALDTMPAGALYLPAGTYVLSDRLEVSRSGIVIRGAGQGSTILKFVKSFKDLYDGGKLVPTFTAWKYGQGGLIWFGNKDYTVRGSQLATVTAAALRGDRTLTLSSTSGISAGQYILLEIDNADLLSFKRYLYGPPSSIRVNNPPAGMHYRWPVKVLSKSGNQITLQQPLRTDIRLTWSPKIAQYNFISEVAIENLKFQFPDLVTAGHHLEPGYNAFCFWGCLNSWARNIDIVAADDAVDINYMSKHVTLQGVRILPRPRPGPGGRHGHHGFSININATDNLLTGCSVEAQYDHPIDLTHFVNGNVIKNGWGTNLNMGHHMDAPFENLWCNLSLGNPTWGGLPNPYGSSGGAGEAHAARWHTYWNVTTNAGEIAPPQNYKDLYWDHPYTYDFHSSIVVPSTETRNDEWCFAEQISGSLVPADLHASQLQRRLGSPSLDTTPPQVSVTAPTGGSTVGGTITLSATATDDVGVAGVQFQLDGINIGSEDTTTPYSLSWGSASASNGTHTIGARARDAAGNSKTATVTVTVQNTTTDTTLPQVTLTAPTGGVVSGTVTLSATASDNVGVVGVQFQVDGTNVGSEDTTIPYSMNWTSGTVSNGTHTITARARDAAGNARTATSTVTVQNSSVLGNPPLPGGTTRTAGSVAKRKCGLTGFEVVLMLLVLKLRRRVPKCSDTSGTHP